jgi:hypothetical protein
VASIFYSIVPLLLLLLVIVVLAIISFKKSKAKLPQRYRSGRKEYIPGEFSAQMELDLRLPYRRFKQLYPSNTLTYKEYKKLQTQRAFRRSMSSQDNKRMVR